MMNSEVAPSYRGTDVNSHGIYVYVSCTTLHISIAISEWHTVDCDTLFVKNSRVSSSTSFQRSSHPYLQKLVVYNAIAVADETSLLTGVERVCEIHIL